MIAQNIKHGRYRSLDEVERDLLQMVKNAKTFNEPKSLIYKVLFIKSYNITFSCQLAYATIG